MKEPLTNAEWVVMNALFEESPLTLSEVIRKIGDRVSWSYRTYASYLAILSRKGAVSAHTRFRDKLYYPLVTREECLAAESRGILGKIKAGAVKDLIASMVREGGLIESDRRELIAMLESLGEKSGQDGPDGPDGSDGKGGTP